MPPTATYRLIDHMLDGQLDAFVLDRRQAGLAWRLIARDLYYRTGVDVTDQALRTWYRTPAA